MSADEDTISEELEIEEHDNTKLIIKWKNFECDTDNEDEWPEEYKSGFAELSAASTPASKKEGNPPSKGISRAKPFNGLQWNVLEAKLEGSRLQEYIQQYEKKYVDAKSVVQITEGKLPLSFNVVTRNHKTVLGQFWKFVQVYEPQHAFSMLDVVSKTRLTAFSRFLAKKYNEPQTISNKLGHLGRLLVWLGEHSEYAPHHKHVQECRTYLRRLINPFEQQKRGNKDKKQSLNKAKGRCMTGEELEKLKEKLEADLSNAENEFPALVQKRGVSKKFAFDFQTHLQTLLLLESDIQIRDVIVNIAQHKVSRIGDVKSEISSQQIAVKNFSVAHLKPSILAESTDMAEIAINVLWNGATNQNDAECQNINTQQDNIAHPLLSKKEAAHKHNPNRIIDIHPKLHDRWSFFKEKIRPYLSPISEDYVWVATHSGNVQQSNQMTIAIQAYLAEAFPGKKIGPLDLKRSMTEARKLKENMAAEASLSDENSEL